MAGSKGQRGRTVERPLSPHLQIYKPHINMVMSILHRVTGAALYMGSLLLAWWVIAVATGPEYFAFVNGLLGTWLGRLVLFGFTWALINHMLGGIRHFIWDFGLGFSRETIDLMSWGSAAAAILLTIALWAFVLGRMGGMVP